MKYLTVPETKAECLEFLYDPDNVHNCLFCFLNGGFTPGPDDKLPCGQYHCWVAVHCNGGEK